MKKQWLHTMEADHKKLMAWSMKHPFARRSDWPGWEHQKHHGLFFHPCIIDWVYSQHYRREPKERCSYCPLARIKTTGNIECCHGYMLDLERALDMHDRARYIAYANEIRNLEWKNPHDVRTAWHTARLIGKPSAKDFYSYYRPNTFPIAC
jgi:hypothetical protein